MQGRRRERGDEGYVARGRKYGAGTGWMPARADKRQMSLGVRQEARTGMFCSPTSVVTRSA